MRFYLTHAQAVGVQAPGESAANGDARASAGAYARDAGAAVLPLLEEKVSFFALVRVRTEAAADPQPQTLLPDAKERIAFLQMIARRVSSLLLENE